MIYDYSSIVIELNSIMLFLEYISETWMFIFEDSGQSRQEHKKGIMCPRPDNKETQNRGHGPEGDSR